MSAPPKRWIGASAGLALALALPLLCACAPGPHDPGHGTRVQAGEVTVEVGAREVLLEDGALGLDYFPDGNVMVLGRDPLRLLVVSKISTYLVEGADMRHLERASQVLAPGPPGSFDNGYAGIGGVYRQRDGRLYAVYHAEDQEDMPRLPGFIPGFMGSVGLAVSDDDGRSFEKLGAILTGARPKHFQSYPGQGANGVGIPSLAVDPNGEHLLLYYNEFSQIDRRGVQVFLARAPLGDTFPGPGEWRKYHAGAFTEPGLGGEETAVLSGADLDESNALQPHVFFSPYLERYVMIFGIDYWKDRMRIEGIEPQLAGHPSGIYLAFSDDGIRWGERQRLVADWTMPAIGGSVSWEPSFVPDDETARSGWLVYGYSDAWGNRLLPRTSSHHMAGRRIRFAVEPTRD